MHTHTYLYIYIHKYVCIIPLNHCGTSHSYQILPATLSAFEAMGSLQRQLRWGHCAHVRARPRSTAGSAVAEVASGFNGKIIGKSLENDG